VMRTIACVCRPTPESRDEPRARSNTHLQRAGDDAAAAAWPPTMAVLLAGCAPRATSSLRSVTP